MYYKVIKNDEVVDVLNHILYIKYQEKHSLLAIAPTMVGVTSIA